LPSHPSFAALKKNRPNDAGTSARCHRGFIFSAVKLLTAASQDQQHASSVQLTPLSNARVSRPAPGGCKDYLVSGAVVGVVSGVCTPPDFGMTVFFKLVGGMFGLFSPTV
jgi:hypothetical protein